MATRKADLGGIHPSGIYADMTVDGPEIGTLVVVVDRAKNLPNRRTMGKQDPYCAARLGKEAKKTTTDRRGGQTPRWWERPVNLNRTITDVNFRDQELRFTVHDSPDYHNLKVSIFNDDKKTELIGETWVSLEHVVVPGGGQSDTWHNLNYRGKYAGEVRMELTYYDSRPKPERPASEQQENAANTPVKRRPLPSNPGNARSIPLGFGSDPRPLPSTAGPREYGTPSRRQMQEHSRSAGNTPSRQSRTAHNNHTPEPLDCRRPLPQPVGYQEPNPEERYQQFDDRDMTDPYASQTEPYYDAPRSEYGYPSSAAGSDLPLGLPELPPMSSSRQSRFVRNRHEPHQPAQQYETFSPQYEPLELHHSYSAPAVPAPDPLPYDDRLTPHLDHTQSDSVLEHGQPQHRPQQAYAASNAPEPYDDYRQDYTPVLYTGAQDERYPQEDQYRRRDDLFDLSSRSNERPYESRHQSLPPELPATEAPPPPPAHKSQSSTPSYTPYRKPLPSHDISPAPLNISPVRLSRGSPMHQTSPIGYHSEPISSPYHAPPPAAPQDIVSYDKSPGYLSEDFGRRSSRQEASYGTPSPQYGYGSSYGSSPDSSHQSHRTSMSQPRDTYSSPGYSAVGGPASTAPLRDHRMSAPYPQQSSPIAYERPSPYSQDHPSPLSVKTPPHRHTPPRPHTMYGTPPSGPYQPSPTQSYNTPPRRHPLSQQQNAVNISPNYNQHSSPSVTTDSPPLIKPRALSPVPTDPRQPRASNRSTPTRKSVSPRPPEPTDRRGSEIPFGPDSYDQFNPSARSTSSLANNPATSGPHTPVGSGQNSSHQSPYTDTNEPIVDFHGNKIDPSDRLPESSWAPEPEKKIPVKVKPIREREKLTGARPRASPDEIASTGGVSTKTSPSYSSPSQTLNQRLHNAASVSPLAPRAPPVETTPPNAAATMGRNKLRKINASNRPHSMAALPPDLVSRPFANIPAPGYASAGATPYASSGGAPGRNSMYGNYRASKSSYNLGAAQKPPPVPAKVPLDDMAVLSEEMRRIDIGPSSAPGSGVRDGGRGRRRLLGFRG